MNACWAVELDSISQAHHLEFWYIRQLNQVTALIRGKYLGSWVENVSVIQLTLLPSSSSEAVSEIRIGFARSTLP